MIRIEIKKKENDSEDKVSAPVRLHGVCLLPGAAVYNRPLFLNFNKGR